MDNPVLQRAIRTWPNDEAFYRWLWTIPARSVCLVCRHDKPDWVCPYCGARMSRLHGTPFGSSRLAIPIVLFGWASALCRASDNSLTPSQYGFLLNRSDRIAASLAQQLDRAWFQDQSGWFDAVQTALDRGN